MTDGRNELVRLGPGIYRRGNQYVVRYREPTGRQRKRTVGLLRDAEMPPDGRPGGTTSATEG